MSAQYVTALDLFQKKPNASCCDCKKEAAEAPEQQVWTIWNNKLIYCPDCAKKEGIGPN